MTVKIVLSVSVAPVRTMCQTHSISLVHIFNTRSNWIASEPRFPNLLSQPWDTSLRVCVRGGASLIPFIDTPLLPINNQFFGWYGGYHYLRIFHIGCSIANYFFAYFTRLKPPMNPFSRLLPSDVQVTWECIENVS